jgi:hypothetical protein
MDRLHGAPGGARISADEHFMPEAEDFARQKQ